MTIELTEEEIEVIRVDLRHILMKYNIPKDPKKARESVLSKLKPELMREEITANWVKENNITVGSKVRIIGCNIARNINNDSDTIGDVVDIFGDNIMVKILKNNTSWCEYFPIESLEPYKEEWIPFRWEDRDLFRDKWVKFKNGTQEFIATAINKGEISFGSYIASYKEAFEKFEFVDGTPFGKLK